MLTLREIAADWQCTPQYVSECVKKGCPKDSFESAREWRNAHTERKSKKGPPSIPPEETVSTPYQKNGSNGHGLDAALENSIAACSQAWLILEEAFTERKASKISVWLNLHNKAVEGRVRVEKLIREEMERQGVLIPISEAQATGRRVIEIVVSRLSAMPQNLAYACNPSAPDHAFEILQRECARILADAQKAIA